MSETLAVKYRPKTFDEVVEQDSVKAILQNQIKTNEIKGAYLFEGPAGCGKTTSARLFANAINGGVGDVSEIDAASNNSVDDVRRIREGARFQSLTSNYKCYILDECHLLSASAWGALLKLLEEPPAKTIFILCTTDAQKVPQTIVSRVQTFRFTKISLIGIERRLDEICDLEYGCYPLQKGATEYLAKQAQGGMREAISIMGKVLDCFDKSKLTDDCVSVADVVRLLGTVDYDVMLALAASVLLKSGETPSQIIQGVYSAGKDLKLFLRGFLEFAMDLAIWFDTRDISLTSLPPTDEWASKICGLCQQVGDKGPILNLMDTALRVANDVKWDPQPKTVICAELELLREELSR